MSGMIPLKKGWTKKPPHHVPLNRSHKFAPNKLCMFFNLAPHGNMELVNNEFPVVTQLDDLSLVYDSIEGNYLDVAYDGTNESSYAVPAFTLTDSIPWEITFRINITGSSPWSMIIGTSGDGNDFIGANEGSSLRLRNSGASDYDFTSETAFTNELKTYTITSDGAGSASCSLKLYTDGVLVQTIGSATSSFIVDSVLDAYSTDNTFSFHGGISHIRASEGKLYSDEEVESLHNNLYQVLQPQTLFIPSGTAAAASSALLLLDS